MCSPCPEGRVSEAGAVKKEDCCLVTGLCPAGEFGYNLGNCSDVTNSSDVICTECPDGYTSKEGAEEKKECYKTNSSCLVGTWDSCTNSSSSTECCKDCDQGWTSSQGAVKQQECYNPTSECEPGTWGEESTCSPCPTNFTSETGAVKEQECYYKDSFCSTGQWGFGSHCLDCPGNKTSLPKTRYYTDCFEVEEAKDPKKSYRGFQIGTIAVLVFMVVAGSVTAGYLGFRNTTSRRVIMSSCGSGLRDGMEDGLFERQEFPSVFEETSSAHSSRRSKKNSEPVYDVCEERKSNVLQTQLSGYVGMFGSTPNIVAPVFLESDYEAMDDRQQSRSEENVYANVASVPNQAITIVESEYVHFDNQSGAGIYCNAEAFQ